MKLLIGYGQDRLTLSGCGNFRRLANPGCCILSRRTIFAFSSKLFANMWNNFASGQKFASPTFGKVKNLSKFIFFNHSNSLWNFNSLWRLLWHAINGDIISTYRLSYYIMDVDYVVDDGWLFVDITQWLQSYFDTIVARDFA